MKNKEKTHPSEEQLIMLKISEEDIKYGRTISQDEMDKSDIEWLKVFSEEKS